MNERMVELYKEACEFAYNVCKEEGRTGGSGDHIWNILSTGRFAELIVKESMTMCDELKAQYFTWQKGTMDFDEKNIYAEGGAACNVIKNKMKKHFGVE